MAIEIHLNDDAKLQSVEAGFSSVEDYLHSLLERDRNRLAVLRGMQDVESGCVRSFDEFDREFREKRGIQREE